MRALRSPHEFPLFFRFPLGAIVGYFIFLKRHLRSLGKKKKKKTKKWFLVISHWDILQRNRMRRVQSQEGKKDLNHHTPKRDLPPIKTQSSRSYLQSYGSCMTGPDSVTGCMSHHSWFQRGSGKCYAKELYVRSIFKNAPQVCFVLLVLNPVTVLLR